MFEKLRDANENVSALAFLAMSFVGLYLIAGIVHPELLGLGSDADADAPDAAASAPAKSPAKTVPAKPPAGSRTNQ